MSASAIHRYDHLGEFPRRVIDAANGSGPPISRILEIGCGSGTGLVALATAFPEAAVIGVDMSPESVGAARQRVAEAGLGERVKPIAGDWLSLEARPEFDLIVAESVLHLLDCSDETMFGRLSSSLRPGGRVVATLPEASWRNRMLGRVRRVAAARRSDRTDWVFLHIAQLVHPRLDPLLLAQRLPYMYAVPSRVVSAGFWREAGRAELMRVNDERLRAASIGQLRHRLVVLERG
jgi:SAM-dependent methyltransferase